MLELLVFQVLLPVFCRQCALPVTQLLNGGLRPDGRRLTGAQWRRWLDSLRQMYPGDGQTWCIRNPQGCPSCTTRGLPELNGYAGRTVAAEIIEPGVDGQVLGERKSVGWGKRGARR